MLGIPLISEYIHKVVKPQVVADKVDFLNYYATSLLLALVALAISAKQYFGSPIQCWVPMEFRGGWEKYAEDYCFIQNSYYIPFTEQIPEELHERNDQISYYRWVPIVLALQALMFFAPNYFWNILYKETAIQPQGIVKEAKKCSTLHGHNRDVEIRNLAEYIGDTVSLFSSQDGFRVGFARSGRNATMLYLLTKLLYVLNIIGQIYMLNHFFGGDYLQWGFQTITEVVSGREWMESAIFPRVIMCDFQVRRLGNIQRHTVQCVIMMNMINEKFYLFLLFWFIFIGICTVINFLYYLFLLCMSRARAQLVLWNINKREWELSGFHNDDMKRFVNDFLRPDGVLLLKFISEHVDARISRDLVNELIRIYSKQQNISLENDSKQTSSVSSEEKALITSSKTNKKYYGNFGKNIKSLYPSKGNIPIPSQMQHSPLYGTGYESAPVLEDLVDGTLPIRAMARARVTQSQNHSTENVYGSPGSQLRQNTPTEV
ncbi:innexin family protein [Wuchereria bancrofti]|uniref:Innexin n=1 Tax=Wuchereria bancrofti TaxID=6293 RepID=J9BJK4_WUCBA|nr:innexin family protein [Wuchereria bancrofti]